MQPIEIMIKNSNPKPEIIDLSLSYV